MPKHIQGRATLKMAKSARPLRVSIWRTATASRRLSDTPVSHCAPLLVVPASAARLARCETEPAANPLKGLQEQILGTAA